MIAQFLNDRDNKETDTEEIFLTNGASLGASFL